MSGFHEELKMKNQDDKNSHCLVLELPRFYCTQIYFRMENKVNVKKLSSINIKNAHDNSYKLQSCSKHSGKN